MSEAGGVAAHAGTVGAFTGIAVAILIHAVLTGNQKKVEKRMFFSAYRAFMRDVS
jgi:hypothetical protein